MYQINAFVSCSLREEDRPFVDEICQILKKHKVNPFGTVGKFSASPENPMALMGKNIPEADIVVICATQCYLQEDIKTGEKTNGLSEMIHVEAGMALAHGKPVVVFAKNGTNVGKALPNITQYVELDENCYTEKKRLVRSLLLNAHKAVQTINERKTLQLIIAIIIGIFAVYGFFTFVGKALKD